MTTTPLPSTDELLHAPWQRKKFGGLEYLLDAEGRTICLRVAGSKRHEALMALLESVPMLLSHLNRMIEAEHCQEVDDELEKVEQLISRFTALIEPSTAPGDEGGEA